MPGIGPAMDSPGSAINRILHSPERRRWIKQDRGRSDTAAPSSLIEKKNLAGLSSIRATGYTFHTRHTGYL
jgi:hypothetical protein